MTDYLFDPDLLRRLTGATPPLDGVEDDAPEPRRKRNPPRLDPVKSAARAIRKNPDLVARIKPDGEVVLLTKAEAASSDESKSAKISDIELDATANNDVWDAIARMRGSNGRH